MTATDRGGQASRETGHRWPRPARPWLPRLAVVLVAAAALLGGALTAPAAGGATSTPAARRVPFPGQFNDLFGAACPSSSDCWAVGEYQDVNGALLNQILHWNGTAWSLSGPPNPGGDTSGSFSGLSAISCASASNCWAVGDYDNSAGGRLDQALHWNGTKWSLVPTPQPGGTTGRARLQGVRCASASNCWAVGDYIGGTVDLDQALHWNGTKWSLAPTPQPGGTTEATLNGVSCASASNCWAVGSYDATSGPQLHLNQVLHWNGTKWSVASPPQPGGTASGSLNDLFGVSCASASRCWAAGQYGTAGQALLNQALFWNGSAWSLVTTPNPDGTGGINTLSGVTCTSAGNCWAVGDYGGISGGVGVEVNQALHWDGSAWSLVSTPDPGGLSNNDANILFAVRCASATSCLAVGYVSAGGSPVQNQALFWNGTSWSSG